MQQRKSIHLEIYYELPLPLFAIEALHMPSAAARPAANAMNLAGKGGSHSRIVLGADAKKASPFVTRQESESLEGSGLSPQRISAAGLSGGPGFQGGSISPGNTPPDKALAIVCAAHIVDLPMDMPE